MTPNSVAKSETTPDESVTCIAVKEERHQNIICSVVLKEKNRITMGKWKSGKIHQLVSVERNHVEKRYRAGNNRVQKSCSCCKAEVTLEDAVKRDEFSKWNGRKRSDVVAWCHQNCEVPCGELYARRTPRRLPNLAVVGGTCGEHFVQVPEVSRRSDAL